MKSVRLNETATIQIQGFACRTGAVTKVSRGKVQSDLELLEWPHFRGSDFSVFEKMFASYYLTLSNQNYSPL